jgi:5-amino-6-(5-phosphoribosylamino)uracil reductase
MPAMRTTLRRPRVIANLAVSVDGKIDTALREGGGFSSRYDRDRMDAIRAETDALVVGARTIRSENPPLHVRDPGRRHARVARGLPEQLTVVVLSRTGNVPAQARFLTGPAAARLLAVPAGVDDAALAHLQGPIESGELEVLRAGDDSVDPAGVLHALAVRGAQSVLVEGGGETLASFLDRGLLDEMRITLCPTILGGRKAPTVVAGEGWPLAARRRMNLLDVERVGDELFLRYEVGEADAGT